MLKKYILQSFSVVLIFVSPIFAQTSAFTYQGKLTDNGTPPTGSYDMQFQLFDALSGGNAVGGVQNLPGVSVASGIFTVQLDFGAAAFNSGADRWLEIAVRQTGNPNPHTILSPRQPISSSPFSIRSLRSADAELFGGQNPLFYRNADNIISGILDDSHLSSNIARLDQPNQTFTGNTTISNLTLASGGQLFGARFENSATDPALSGLSPASSEGQTYFNTDEKNLKVFDGTDWRSIVSRRTTTHSGSALVNIPCNNVTQTGDVHTVSFNKTASASRLRINYSDVAFVRLNTTETNTSPWVEVRIDGSSITPTPIRMQFLLFQDEFPGTGPPEFSKQFTIFGYANNIPAGSHTLTVRYFFENLGSGSGRLCYRGYPFFSGRIDPFSIEIEEVP